MSSSCESLTDTVPQCKATCNSHISVYYEQNQKEEEETKPNYCEANSYCCEANSYCCEQIVPRCPLVEIHEEETTCIDLPPLIWHGYSCCPRVLTITNTGRTISINGNWTCSRPYIEGGPLNGTYLLSQIHFHCPSEHVIDGRRYPLEMHIVHYKTSYLTQERAMQERDGTVVLVYLFQCVQMGETIMSRITRLAPDLMEANKPMEICDIPLGELIKPFMSNYYVYWGSIATKNNCYLLQWIVNCNLLRVTKQEAEDLSNIITCAVGIKVQRTPRVIPDYDAIYHVGEADYSLSPLKIGSCSDICNICKSGQSEVLLACDCQSKTSLSKSSCGKRCGSKCSKCRIFNITRDTCCGSSKCSKCKIVNITPDTCCEARKGLVIVKKVSVKKSKKKKTKKGCAQKSKDKSESESLLSCVCDVNEKKIKKFKKKKLFRKLKKLCDSESEKSSSKSSVCSDKLKVKVDIVPQNCDSEVEESSKKKITEEECDEKVEKGKRRKKEVTVVQSAYSIKEGASKSTLKASADLSFLGMNVSGLNLFNPNCSADDNDKTEERNKKEPLQNLEFKTEGEMAEKCSKTVLTKESGSNLDEGKKEIISSKDDNSKSPMVTRRLKSRPKSPTNVQKPNDPETSEGRANNRATSRSKSKSPVIDALKRKMSLKKNRERSSSNSKSKMLKSDSKSKIPRSKKVAESAKSAQEVKCTATVTKVKIDNLKCDTSLSGNMKTKSNKRSSKIMRSKSKEAAKGKNKADGKGPKGKQDDEITTIFEKKKNGKKVQSVTGDGNDVNVNFLLTPGNAGIPSNSQTTSESDITEEKKVCEDINENWGPFDETFTVNTAAILESEFPRNQLKENSKGCFLMEHLFRTEYKDKTCECSSQEYHLAIIYDQCILQEYRGKFHPQELQLGDCKMLTLFPKYPEPRITNFQLRDCSIKKESLDQICIRVKFILKDLNVLHIFANTQGRPNGTPEKKETLLYDQQIQCNLKELNFAENCELKFIEQSKNYKKIENCETNENLFSELTSDNKEKLSNQLENKEKQMKQSKDGENQKLLSDSNENLKWRSKSKERQNMPSESEEKLKLGSKSKERQNLRSKSKEDQKLQSEIEEKQKMRSKSKERQNVQSENEEKQKLGSKSKERQNLRSESEEKLKLRPKSKERQNMRSKSKEDQKLQSNIEEKQKMTSESKERQNEQSESEEKQKLGSKSKERQNMRSKSNEYQKLRSEIEEKQKMRSKSKERQNVQSGNEENIKLGSKSREGQNLLSKSKENQKSESESEEKQNLLSETEGNQKSESKTKDKLKSKSKENQEMPPEDVEKQKLQSKRKENQNMQLQSEENRKIQSENEEMQKLQSESDNCEKIQSKVPLESEVNQKMQSESKEKQKLKWKRKEKRNLRSNSKENQRMQSESETNQKIPSESEVIQRLPSESDEYRKIQSENEEMQKLQSESDDNEKMQSKVLLESEVNQKTQSESKEKQKLKWKRKEKQNLRSKSKENQRMQSESETNQKMPSESEENQKLQSEIEEKQKLQSNKKDNKKLRSKSKENQVLRFGSEEKQNIQSESDEKRKLQSESEGSQKMQSKMKEEANVPLENKEMLNLQLESEEKQKLQSKRNKRQILRLKRKENQKLQLESEEKQKVQSGIEEMQTLQSQSEEKQKQQSESEDKQKPQENKWIFWEKGISEHEKSGVKPERDTEVCSQDASQSCFIEQVSLDSNRKMSKVETLCSEQSEKKLKALFVKRRKTVYFIYDKVEKDENTGKQIFVGSFKTKEEVENLKKQKALLQENEVAGKKSGKTSEVKRKIENIEGSSKENSSSTDKNSLSVSEGGSHRKIDVITLLKYIPKRLKKGSKNVLIEKAADNSQENGKSSTKVGKIMSGHKKSSSKAFIYEPKEPSESESQENAISDGGKREEKSEAVNVDVIKGRDDHSQSEVNVSGKSSNAEEDSVRDNSK